VRTCPLCRETSFFIVPSTVYPADEEHRDELCRAFRAKTAAIPCRHFNHGEGTWAHPTSLSVARKFV
jgi:E3 ubiquitin-protein ligase makorin